MIGLVPAEARLFGRLSGEELLEYDEPCHGTGRAGLRPRVDHRQGKIVVTGIVDEVRGGKAPQRAFIDLVGPRATDEEVLSWLGSSSS